MRRSNPGPFCVLRRQPVVREKCPFAGLSKRLMGLEPTTFCMASRANCSVAAAFSLQMDHFCAAVKHRSFPRFRHVSTELCPPIVPRSSCTAEARPRASDTSKVAGGRTASSGARLAVPRRPRPVGRSASSAVLPAPCTGGYWRHLLAVGRVMVVLEESNGAWAARSRARTSSRSGRALRSKRLPARVGAQAQRRVSLPCACGAAGEDPVRRMRAGERRAGGWS
jgi:hypothetical protein